MILSELQRYLSQQHRASLAQLEVKFQVDADALRGMLHVLRAKGRVHQLPSPDRCHGCDVCSQESLEFYEWRPPQSMLADHVPQSVLEAGASCGGACGCGSDK